LETLIYLASSLVFLWNESPRNFRRYAKAASNNFNTGVAKQFSAPVDSFSGGFGANKFQGAFNKTVLPECLVNKRLLLNSKPYEGP
jgi:hypothetical protein